MVDESYSNPRTTTFLFTDLENSSIHWENHPDLMKEFTARHDAVIRQAIVEHRGQVVKGTGDGFHAAFDSATDGAAAALAGQIALREIPWPAGLNPLRVRMGLHTGESQERNGDYYGSEVNRAARIMGLAHGGQILVSASTAALLNTSGSSDRTLASLGEHRLRGLVMPEHIWQLCHPSLPVDFPQLQSLSTVKHNIPVQVSTFVGRQHELAEVKRLLDKTHLLTLLGPGGTGKTRLMLETAEELIKDFTDGVWLVELAPLTDPELIFDRVAAAISVQEQPGMTLLDSLVAFLRQKDLLLLLDNAEHIVRECAEMVQHLLSHCPKLKILVTGREALFIPGEVTLQLPSLSLPPRKGQLELDQIRASEAVQLFLTRAQEVRTDFELNQANAKIIAEIVQRLDGIPLALELATARLRMLSIDQIAKRLDDRFRLLTGGRRTALARQQTLRAMIDWSWNLLDENERLLLVRLSVFSGSWSMEAAQSVVVDDQLDEYQVFDYLEQLVNKSLVVVKQPATGEARYSMLESIRQYGREHLFESGEGQTLRDRHADYYVAFAEEVGPHQRQETMLTWIERITAELDNLRAVMTWTLEEKPELSLRIAGNLIYQEVQWIHPSEARSWLEPSIEKARLLLAADSPAVRMSDFIKALIGLGATYSWYGRQADAAPLLEEGIDLARTHGETRHLLYATGIKFGGANRAFSVEEIAELQEAIAIGYKSGFHLETLYPLGSYIQALIAEGKMEEAEKQLENGTELISKINNPYITTAILAGQGYIAWLKGDLAEAKRIALIISGNYEYANMKRSMVTARSQLAHIARAMGDIDEAESVYRQTVLGWQELGHLPAVAHQVECFAYIALERHQYERSARLLGAAGRARQHPNMVSTDPREIAELKLAKQRLSKAIGEEERDMLLAEGAQMDLDDAVNFALDSTPL